MFTPIPPTAETVPNIPTLKRKTPPMASREGRTAAPGAFGSHQTNDEGRSLNGVTSSADKHQSKHALPACKRRRCRAWWGVGSLLGWWLCPTIERVRRWQRIRARFGPILGRLVAAIARAAIIVTGQTHVYDAVDSATTASMCDRQRSHWSRSPSLHADPEFSHSVGRRAFWLETSDRALAHTRRRRSRSDERRSWHYSARIVTFTTWRVG